jgi:hypothetical protein
MRGPTPGIASAPIPASKRAGVVGQQHGNVVVGKSRRHQAIDSLFCFRARLINSEYCRIFSCHIAPFVRFDI